MDAICNILKSGDGDSVKKQEHKKRYVKEQQAKARQLYPSMQVGKSGITQGLVDELKLQLKAKKMIKVKFMKSFIEGIDKKAVARDLARKLDAVLIQQIGGVVVFAKRKKINK